MEEGKESISGTLPEVLRLGDARPGRPENAVGAAGFWHEPEVWSLPLSPAARVLYAGLCSFLAHGEINRRDLRNALASCSDAQILEALEELVRRNLLAPEPAHRDGIANYAVHSVRMLED